MFKKKCISLDPRLSMIAYLIDRCECLADIGCDHGRLGAFMLQADRCKRATLTDISEASLRKARSLIGLLGLSDRVHFKVGDGLSALDEPADVVVIAGMGGATIAEIIRAGRKKLGDARLVLQPNVAAPELRGALSACGYRIVGERVTQDGRRNYVIISAEPGESEYSLKQQIVGPVLLQTLPAELLPYAKFRLRVAEKALKGADRGGDVAQADALREEISIWEDESACLQQ